MKSNLFIMLGLLTSLVLISGCTENKYEFLNDAPVGSPQPQYLEVPLKISGKVIDTESKSPLSNVSVFAISANNAAIVLDSSETDDDGYFVFEKYTFINHRQYNVGVYRNDYYYNNIPIYPTYNLLKTDMGTNTTLVNITNIDYTIQEPIEVAKKGNMSLSFTKCDDPDLILLGGLCFDENNGTVMQINITQDSGRARFIPIIFERKGFVPRMWLESSLNMPLIDCSVNVIDNYNVVKRIGCRDNFDLSEFKAQHSFETKREIFTVDIIPLGRDSCNAIIELHVFDASYRAQPIVLEGTTVSTLPDQWLKVKLVC